MNGEINIIAAVADNYAIGNRGELLWHISEDLKYFKSLTMGCPVVMGRKTFESLGRPLPGRLNIVVSRSGWIPKNGGENVVVKPSLEEAIKTDGEIFIIGGGEIYRQAMQYADRLYITQVHSSPQEADTFFPEISQSLWQKTSESEPHRDEKSGLSYEFVIYNRKKD